MKAIIELNVPEFQIGQEVSVYFRDTMCVKGICEEYSKIIPKDVELEGGNSIYYYVCPECHSMLAWKDARCKICKQAVKWDA